jgi:hypothetical protein
MMHQSDDDGPVEELGMRETACNAFSDVFIVGVDPEFLQRDNVVVGLGQLGGNGGYTLRAVLGEELESPVSE